MADSDRITVVAVAGPTASGKTSLGVGIARVINGEVISCDSMQVYRNMAVATAAPGDSEMQGIKHHLIGFLDTDEEYSVARFCSDASDAMRDIVSRGKVPILVGGTGLYMSSFVDNITFSGDGGGEIRRELFERADREGIQSLLFQLTDVDPEYAAKLNINDKKRIIRALELYLSSGITMTEQIARSHDNTPPFDTFMIGITFSDRQKLYDRINKRVDMMVAGGLVEEAYAAYQNKAATAAQAIGHKELFDYFEGKNSLEQCVEKLKMQTRRYAKRQLSWFRRDDRIHWIYADDKSADEVLSEALKLIREETDIEYDS